MTLIQITSVTAFIDWLYEEINGWRINNPVFSPVDGTVPMNQLGFFKGLLRVNFKNVLLGLFSYIKKKPSIFNLHALDTVPGHMWEYLAI